VVGGPLVQRLPGRPSALLRAALASLERIERATAAHPDVDLRRELTLRLLPLDSLVAGVLVGRRVALRTAGHPAWADGKVAALDHLRQGLVEPALALLGCWLPGYRRRLAVVPYDEDPALFKLGLRAMAVGLQEDGL
jgi:hypothetical protein